MTKTLIWEMTIALCLLSGGAIATAHQRQTAVPLEQQLALDGAFRDGLYVGQLTARSGGPERPPIGRWSDDSDRASFLAGYERGYESVLSQRARKHEPAE